MFKLKAATSPKMIAFLAAWAIGQMAGNEARADQPILGEIMLFGANFCPRDWASADGKILPIAQNTALYSLYGTIYGGDGRTTFALPNLNDRPKNGGARATPLWCVAMKGTYPSRG